MHNDCVQTDQMLYIHKAANDLQRWSVEGYSVIKAKDVVLDPSSNAIYIGKRCSSLNTMIQFRAPESHNSHVINEWQGHRMLG